ncbi:MAG: bifunctional glutamate N-acetyltransferase/amino-acid acetyltransferase ArgJ [Desulfomonilia bacterium]|nr:bifunctional glutamate N-acetyltransferase/amino-acid acetyltransferase ArgJ [Pseudomonadota bacterium]HON38381.1 bifunctional glutamate N-acetyltransferase/amino-acid acetyltransferase ArgJ [Deltaproteobacteria bacterium]HRS56418.1 bifunctional glutamate N-acetyltransferase/amino-acid acetyltransferase ArgJ [Desulfomonilia bacterium]HPD21572.1 bifunctional glutamate N-acetyltransferase/amino-acid acetyltransferase ArgJ [Deltaproteobacteria bacterium]HPX17230.1 bifunctional glutamate N-acety
MNTPKGFRFSAVNAGVKSPEVRRDDMGLIFCEELAVLSGVFTRNRVKAAPVVIGQEIAGRGKARAVLANAGNANACTGDQGIHDARFLMKTAARELGVSSDEVVPLSTGVIGIRLPVDRMASRIPALVSALGDDPEVFARAIMTTDTFPKVVSRTVGNAAVLGIAKGAGMIAPDMATTLAVVLTDAVISKQDLDNIIRKSIEYTFNAITIDGDMSTNDTLLALSSCQVTESIVEIEKGIAEVIRDLALLLVRDGEGATKLVTITVKGAADEQDAKKAAMSVANSLLVKTALFGADPNWGRILAAVGYSGIAFMPEQVFIDISGYRVVERGMESDGFNENKLHALLKEREIVIEIRIGDGPGAFTAYTTDLSYDYVKINSEYRT